MLSEREMLYEKLENIQEQESALRKGLQQQRNQIYRRLREIDSAMSNKEFSKTKSYNEPKVNYPNMDNIKTNENNERFENSATSLSSYGKHPHLTPKQAAPFIVDYLKKKRKAVTLGELKSVLKDELDIVWSNFSSQMNSVMKQEPKVTRIGHGLYRYIDDNSKVHY